jgi:putative aldouronate transport system substrate-binding protein
MLRKVVTGILIFIMLLSMVGCQNKNDNDVVSDDKKTDTTSGGNEGANKTPTEINWWDKYDETVKLTTAMKDNPIPVFPEGDTMTSNVWTRAYKEKFNIDVVTDWITEDAQYDTKLNLAITSGDLPDTFVVSLTQLKQLVEANMVMDLTEVYEAYGSDSFKKRVDADIDTFNTAKIDDKLYAIPRMHFGNIEQIDQLWLRKDWMEANNLKAPKTIKEMEEICLTFIDQYGGSGLSIDQNLYGLQVLAPSWHATPGVWTEDADGNIVYGSVQPAMKDALATWADWYKKGIINQDFAATDWAGMMAKVVSGEVGVMPWFQWWGYSPGPDVVTNFGPEAIFEPHFLPSADGEKVIQPINFANKEYIVVNKKCKNPEAVIKLLNFYTYINKDAQGKETKEYLAKFVDGSRHVAAGTFVVRDVLGDYYQVDAIREALETGDESMLTSSASRKYEVIKDFMENKTPAAVGDYMQQGHEKSAYGIGKQVLDDGDYFLSKLWGDSPDELLRYGTTLDDLLLEGFTKIIMGAEPVDYFDELVKQWKSAGGEQVTKAMNEMYN